MINLLPYEMKKELAAARANTVLLRYNVILLAAAGFVAAAVAVVYIFLMNIQSSAETTIAENQAREQSYAQVRQQSQTFQSQLTDAKKILDSEISYSRALVNYANLFPDGTAIDSIQLNEQSFDKPIDVSVKITGQSAAEELIKSMESSPYVSNFQRKEISFNEGNPTYPYTMGISFSISKEIANS